jgi:hypothetical protein
MTESEAVMTAADHLGSQWAESTGDPDAKKALMKQLKPDFPKAARAWLKDDRVTVDAPAKINPGDIDFSGYPDWRASKQLKSVVKMAKKGKDKPSVLAARPGGDKLDLIDGRHHALARMEQKKKPHGYVVHVPSSTGPWDAMEDRQAKDNQKDDF